ncbi:MAG TPA: peptidase S41, partial [Leeuwenhoekiella sp.]|nr:peptidase S41 [Leeuwenhoekiella sp.]
MKKITLSLTLLTLLILASCSKDRDDELAPLAELEIENFIYNGMQLYYLYQPEIPQLGNTFFESTTDLNVYLSGFAGPEDLFYNGLVADVDRFSFLSDD